VTGKAGKPSKAPTAPANAGLPTQAGTQSETAKPAELAPPPTASRQLRPSHPPASRSTVFRTHVDDAPRPKLGLTCHAGLAPSTGTMTEYHRTGWSVGGGLAYNLTDRFAIDLLSLGVDHFPLDRKEANINPPPGGSMTMISITTGLRGRLTRGHTAVFLAAGTGLFGAAHWDLELSNGETVPGNDRVSLGWNIGAGLDRRLDETRTAFTEFRATFATTAYENSTYYPVRGGLRFDLW
jgi:opacity protein-like surface antigen